jgi:hypothetical protein
MREARIKVNPNTGEAVYHCISKAVAAAWLFDEVARDVFRRQLWRAADYCGLQIITYTILSNHFHVLVRVPKFTTVSDDELLRRYCLYCDKTDEDARARLATIRFHLAANNSKAEAWRRRQIAQMGDVSAFMKKWKQRFSQWFNRSHRRIGTLWASRFTSILIQPEGLASEFVSAYVDLNAVRANIVRDPKDYRFCGYAEAIIGHRKAREGIMSLYRMLSWKETQGRYRQTLFGIGADARARKGSIRYEDFREVIRKKGMLPLSEVILCRLRHFVHGGILGTQAFVQEQIAVYEARTRKRPRTRPRPLPPACEWGDLCVMRNVRQQDAA